MISGITWKCLTAAVNLHRDIGRRQYNHCGFMLRRFQGFKVASDIKTNKKQIVSVNGELTIKPCFVQYSEKYNRFLQNIKCNLKTVYCY